MERGQCVTCLSVNISQVTGRLRCYQCAWMFLKDVLDESNMVFADCSRQVAPNDCASKCSGRLRASLQL